MKGNFQIIIMVVFIVAIAFGLLVFSGTIKLGKDKRQSGPEGTVVLWGTVRRQLLSDALEKFNEQNQTFSVQYVEKSADNFNEELLEALASGRGPDIFFITNDLALSYSNKIFGIPYESVPLVSFKNSFAGAGEVFVNSKGILAIPLAIDPLVMYYNRSILDSTGITFPPTTWDEFLNIVPLITEKDENKRISRSTVALGQFENINNAKEIITSIFLQSGNSIVREEQGNFISTLDDTRSGAGLEQALKFYTDFADPLKEAYSWNRSLPNSRDFFSSENLAFYLGYASELETLVNRNPNQNFLIAPIPQIKGSNFKSTYAKVTGIGILVSTKNFQNSLSAAMSLSGGEFAAHYAESLGVAPARRDLLAIKKEDVFSPVVYNSALFARSWLDPSNKDTNDIFRTMIDNILSNTTDISGALTDAQGKMSLLLLK